MIEMKNVKVKFFLTVAICVIALFASLYIPQHHKMSNSEWILNDSQLIQLEAIGKQGNNEASYRVAMYFLAVKMKQDEGFTWMRLAADQGNTKARQSLSNIELDTKALEEIRTKKFGR